MKLVKILALSSALLCGSMAYAQQILEPHFSLGVEVTTDTAWRLTGSQGFPAGAVAIPELTGNLAGQSTTDYMVNFYPEVTPNQAFHLTFTAQTGQFCGFYVGFDKPGKPEMVVTGDGQCTYRVERGRLVLSLGE